jgi:hypothetical protein
MKEALEGNLSEVEFPLLSEKEVEKVCVCAHELIHSLLSEVEFPLLSEKEVEKVCVCAHELIHSLLSEVEFPLLSEKSPAATQSSPAPKARGKATWAAAKPAPKSENKAPPRAGPRLFVFVVGGTPVSSFFSFTFFVLGPASLSSWLAVHLFLFSLFSRFSSFQIENNGAQKITRTYSII